MMLEEKPVKPHYHKDENGVLRKCYHAARSVLTTWQFWLGITISYPFEHYLWEKVWPFYLLSEQLGIIGH